MKKQKQKKTKIDFNEIIKRPEMQKLKKNLALLGWELKAK
jgi:hypothetical protein